MSARGASTRIRGVSPTPRSRTAGPSRGALRRPAASSGRRQTLRPAPSARLQRDERREGHHRDAGRQRIGLEAAGGLEATHAGGEMEVHQDEAAQLDDALEAPLRAGAVRTVYPSSARTSTAKIEAGGIVINDEKRYRADWCTHGRCSTMGRIAVWGCDGGGTPADWGTTREARRGHYSKGLFPVNLKPLQESSMKTSREAGKRALSGRLPSRAPSAV